MESLGARTAITPAVVRVQANDVKPLRGSAASRVRAVLNKDQDKSADDRTKSSVAGASTTGVYPGKGRARRVRGRVAGDPRASNTPDDPIKCDGSPRAPLKHPRRPLRPSNPSRISILLPAFAPLESDDGRR